MIEGIDISTYQATTPPLAGLDFVFVRAGYGASNADPRYGQHSVAVRSAGKVLGAYWFWYDGSSAGLQADTFLSIAKGADLLALDFEGAAKDAAGAQEFIRLVQASGRTIGLYHSQSGYPSWGQDWNWVARWGTTPPSTPWTFWQWQGSPLDRDRFNGDLAALHVLVGGSMYTFNLVPGAKTGTLTVKADAPHSYLRLLDGTLHPASPTWPAKQAYGPVKLTPPIPGGAAGADRSTAYIIGNEAAAMLASDVVFTADVLDPGAIETARKNGYNAGIAAVQQQANSVKPI